MAVLGLCIHEDGTISRAKYKAIALITSYNRQLLAEPVGRTIYEPLMFDVLFIPAADGIIESVEELNRRNSYRGAEHYAAIVEGSNENWGYLHLWNEQRADGDWIDELPPDHEEDPVASESPK